MNKKIFISTIIATSFRNLIFLALIIWGTLRIINSGVPGESGTLETPLGKIITISFCFSFIFIIYLLINISLLINYYYFGFQQSKIIISLSIITLNIELLCCYFIQNNKNKERTKFKFTKINIYEITVIAVLLAFYFVIGFVTSLIPPMPFYITLSFKYIPLFFGAFILSIAGSAILCFLAATLTVFIPGASIQFWQFIFDYWLSTFMIFIAGFFSPTVKSNNVFTKIAIWFSFITFPIIILYFSRVTSGVVYWLNPNVNNEIGLPEFEWSNSIGYSFIYNSINTIFDYVLLIICVPTMCETLWSVKDRLSVNKQLND
ncbi:energy-coupled thiamine transporter ThiT [Spiroplasma endosymbiont of Diplazon laetatorius]|uniref:energy-coupled thiamine transporter ThiT n=1 Tax=Spiroplasma endosymbiont of Diplazon laetatorius TaxID=3066322 RepID=UPI0030D3525F